MSAGYTYSIVCDTRSTIITRVLPFFDLLGTPWVSSAYHWAWAYVALLEPMRVVRTSRVGGSDVFKRGWDGHKCFGWVGTTDWEGSTALRLYRGDLDGSAVYEGWA